eukprot:TRINITY_DN9971_c0_g1_i2.p1 TRINITY_DN9971_c0_g1~~TRINITY_DN9971_c0_g1_i2.p1  ORF type:complete len:163 (-),score=7.74 TRINITY_DN9971_c0_g1_i2:49-537(-)
MAGRFLKNLFSSGPKFRVVGRDRLGNSFRQASDGDVREVFRPGSSAIDSHDAEIHPLWSSWLRKQRPDIPSDAEVDAFDAQQARLRENVAAIELKDRKARLKEQRDKMYGADGGPPQQGSQAHLSAAQRFLLNDQKQSTSGDAETNDDDETWETSAWTPGKE